MVLRIHGAANYDAAGLAARESISFVETREAPPAWQPCVGLKSLIQKLPVALHLLTFGAIAATKACHSVGHSSTLSYRDFGRF